MDTLWSDNLLIEVKKRMHILAFSSICNKTYFPSKNANRAVLSIYILKLDRKIKQTKTKNILKFLILKDHQCFNFNLIGRKFG